MYSENLLLKWYAQLAKSCIRLSVTGLFPPNPKRRPPKHCVAMLACDAPKIQVHTACPELDQNLNNNPVSLHPKH